LIVAMSPATDKAASESSPRPAAGRGVYLRAVLPAEYEDLYLKQTSSPSSAGLSTGGGMPSFEDWLQGRTRGVLAQRVAIRARDSRRLGLVTAFQPDPQNGHAHIAALSFDPERPSPRMMIGIGLFIDFVFDSWAFHKLYLDVAEYSYPQFASGLDRFYKLEGRLRDHYYLNGRRWDLLVMAISRDAWMRDVAPIVRGGALPADFSLPVKRNESHG
jgi:hypothetical protein